MWHHDLAPVALGRPDLAKTFLPPAGERAGAGVFATWRRDGRHRLADYIAWLAWNYWRQVAIRRGQLAGYCTSADGASLLRSRTVAGAVSGELGEPRRRRTYDATEPVVQTEGGEVNEEAAQERAEDLMGRAEEDVAELEDVRVVHRDGESLDVTADLLPGRMNVTIEDGLVVDVSVEQDPGPPPVQPFHDEAEIAETGTYRICATERAVCAPLELVADA